MFTVIIKDNGEPNVLRLTYDNLWKELCGIDNAELIIAKDWFKALEDVKNNYVCLVEPDCLVSSGYFTSQMGLFKKNPHYRKLAVLGSAVGVKHWGDRVYSFSLGDKYQDGVHPNKTKSSSEVYPVQVAYIPGAIVRVKMLRDALEAMGAHSSWQDDLVFMSTQLSLLFWNQGDGNRVHVNPNTTYVTTEEYVGESAEFDVDGFELKSMFKREYIS